MNDVIIDCDPGIDDALAIALALTHPSINVLGITTVAGNRGLEQVTQNALDLADYLGSSDVAVAAGAPRPLSRDHVPAVVHGDTGLGGYDLARSSRSPQGNAVDLIVDTVMERPAKSVTIVAIAPLTNLALALEQEPAIAERVERVVIMGGGRGVGNLSPVAEFNFYVDPDAAEAVLTGGWETYVLGLDLTWQAGVGPAQLGRVRSSRSYLAPALSAWMDYYARGETNPLGGGPAVHDVCAVAAVIDPSLIEFSAADVHVETLGHRSRGQSIVDIGGAFSGTTNTQWGVRLDRDRFWRLVLDTVVPT